jgi:hypothetical protein
LIPLVLESPQLFLAAWLTASIFVVLVGAAAIGRVRALRQRQTGRLMRYESFAGEAPRCVAPSAFDGDGHRMPWIRPGGDRHGFTHEGLRFTRSFPHWTSSRGSTDAAGACASGLGPPICPSGNASAICAGRIWPQEFAYVSYGRASAYWLS